ncbi:hypothetical protein FNF27_00484 [Cafeteria roenbergensis]|uniref:Uncharacterized protein n=1 Tax=Cafeteria roenbergensis TaxID=33653 RepID=A0A5A8EJ61_CAFRO|nr:hypothetical protein FNF27_00484 [Cafeteria roenbergensis]
MVPAKARVALHQPRAAQPPSRAGSRAGAPRPGGRAAESSGSSGDVESAALAARPPSPAQPWAPGSPPKRAKLDLAASLLGGLELEALDGDAVAGRPNHASASKPGSSNSGGAAAPRWPGHRPARARRPLDSAGAASSVGAGGRAASPGPLETRDAAATSSAAATEWGSSAATGVPLLTANGQAGKRENDGILDSILHRKNFLTQACAVRVMATLLLEAGAALGWSAATGKPLPHFGPEHVVILRTGGWDAMASTLMPEFEYEDSVADSGRADASAPVTPTALAGRADALSVPHGSGARFPPSTALLPSTASGRAEGLGWSDAEGAGLGTTQPQPSNPGDCQHGAASTFDLLGLAAEAGSTEVDEVDLREQHLYASGATTLSCVASDESMGVPAVMRATRVMDAADMGRAGSSSLGAQRADRDAAPQRLEAAIVAPNGGDSAAGKLPMCAPRKLGGKPSAEMPACQQRAAKRDRDRDRDLALLPVPVPQRSWGSWGQQGSSAFASSCFAEPQVTVDSWRPDGQISRPEATSLGTPPAVSHRGVSAATVPAEASSTLHGTGIDSEASGPPSLELRFHEQLEPTSDDEADEPASILLLSAQPFGISSFESDF